MRERDEVVEENSVEKSLQQTISMGQPAWRARTNDIRDKLSRATLYRGDG